MKRVLDLWEDPEFAELFEDSAPLVIVPEACPGLGSLAQDNQDVRQRVDGVIQTWESSPSQTIVGALRVVGLYAQEKFPWQATNDILVTRLVDLVWQLWSWFPADAFSRSRLFSLSRMRP